MTRFNLIDTTFERKASEMVPATPPTPFANAHPRKGPWSGNNQLGYKLPFAPDANNRQTVLKLDEWGYPEVWTISLGIEGFPAARFNGFGVRANISFGDGGSTQTIDVDWRNGTQVSLVMNAVNVIAEFQDLDFDTEAEGLFLTVQVSPGNRPGGRPPVCTLVSDGDDLFLPAPFPAGTLMEFVQIPAGTNTGLLRLPPFAARVVAMPASLDPAVNAAFFSDTTILALYSGNNSNRVVQSLRGSDLRTRVGIEVTGESRFVILYNEGGTQLDCTLYAELAG